MPKTREKEFEEFRLSRYPDERSRGIAERAFAEKKGETPTKKQATMLAEEWLLGPGKKDGPLQTFTDPQGATRTFRSEDATLISEGRPVINDQLYSPYDQRQLHKLYQSRSQAATDPALSEDDRQRALDIFDEQISRVPQLPPSRREPTAQQKFDASMVKGPDGTQYTIGKDGQPKALEQNKAETDERKAYNDELSKNIASIAKEQADIPVASDRMTTGQQIEAAQLRTAITHGFKYHQDFSKTVAPNLKPAWVDAMESLTTKLGTTGSGKNTVQKRATERDMLALMNEYATAGMQQGLSEDIAISDFLDRWNKEYQTDSLGVVPEFSSALKQKLVMGKLRAANPRQQVDPEGPPSIDGAVQVEGDTIRITTLAGGTKTSTAPGLGTAWKKMTRTERRKMQEGIMAGVRAELLVAEFNKKD